MKYSLLLLSLLLLSSCMKQESNELYKNKDASGSISEKISYHSEYEIHHEKDGSTTLIAGNEKNTCPPGMYPKWLDGCVKDPEACPEWQTLTGFAGTAFCAKSDDTRSYYERLWSQCAEDSFWYAGCIASITHMQSRWYRLALSETCPENFKIEWYTVAGWYTWCAPSDTYYTDLRKSCNWDTCCLSSVDAIEQGKYLETKDGTCIAELAPNMQRCLTSKQWCQHSFLVKDFWSGFTLEQTKERTTLYYYKKIVRDWSHTPPKVYPFIENEWCQELFEASMQKNPSPPGLWGPPFYRKYIWNLFTPEEQKACMKAFYKESVRIIPYDTRFVSILWSNYQSYNITIYDIRTGYGHDLLDKWDTVKKIDFVNDTIQVTTGFTKRVDPTLYTTIFNSSFSGVRSTIVSD